MNIVYLTDNYVNPTLGGVGRITHVMAEALHYKYGHKCYSVYANYTSQINDNSVFEKVLLWNGKEDFCDFIHTLNQCVIIIQSPCVLGKRVFEMKPLIPNAKIINVFHGTPGFEIIPLNWAVLIYRFINRIDLKWAFKQFLIQVGMLFLPREYFIRLLRKKYSRPYYVADKMVVLSKGVIKEYQSIAPGYIDKFISISNALSFDNITIPPYKYANKEVLVVARLDDWHKRIFEMLKIWDIVQKDRSLNDWNLRIVGGGIDKVFYEDFVHKHRIPNVLFEGHQNPLLYYKQASIFLMTSACEGFPMTLLEAQQCGCVPIVYDSFASAEDIVTNGVNGVLIADMEIQEFVTSLKLLMMNEDLRKQMSTAGLLSCKRYSVENIALKWEDLLQSLRC